MTVPPAVSEASALMVMFAPPLKLWPFVGSLMLTVGGMFGLTVMVIDDERLVPPLLSVAEAASE